MNQALREELLAMQADDLYVRQKLLDAGELGHGYHPRMEEVHRRNASRLRQLIIVHGWPGKSLVGDDGAEAAWLIVQHSIAEPQFLRHSLPLLERAAASCEIPAWQPAYLLDRICFFEGRPQVYGTHSDWDDAGQMRCYDTADPEQLNERRAAVGLPPASQDAFPQTIGPKDLQQHRSEMHEWMRRVGWR